MATGASIRIELGPEFQSLLRQLRTVDEKAARPILRRGLKAGARVVVNAAKANVPVDTGTLRRALKVRAARRRRRGVMTYTATLDGQSNLFVGDLFYGGFIEFGTKSIRPREFIQKAFDANREAILQAVQGGLAAGIERHLGAA